jgi:hypothetical protein
VIADTAKTKDEEYVRMLEPDLIDQLKKKMDIMNIHWDDCRRIFTQPNGQGCLKVPPLICMPCDARLSMAC